LLIIGIVILVASLIVECAATIRSAQLVNAAGGDWNTKDVRYASEGGPPKWLSAVSCSSTSASSQASGSSS
jgi:hypothetical protein